MTQEASQCFVKWLSSPVEHVLRFLFFFLSIIEKPLVFSMSRWLAAREPFTLIRRQSVTQNEMNSQF